jgi:hypothetical protein
MAIQQTISFARGEDILLEGEFPTPVSGGISGWTMVFEVKESPGGSSVSAEFTAVATVTSSVDCTYTIPITSAQTVNLDPGTYAFDLWRLDSGNFRHLAYGPLKLTTTVRY